MRGNNIYSEEEDSIVEFLKKNVSSCDDNDVNICPPKSFYTMFGKRMVDLLVVIPAIILFLPIFVLLSVINIIDMGFPIFYLQTRTGYKDKDFNIFKFRSMKNIVDTNGRQLPGENRLTKYGRFIRKTSLDELPNLFNILKGEMSIIGPRPLPLFYYERMNERHRNRVKVHPGLECPRMVSMDEEELGFYQVQFENDIWYVKNISFITDIKMVISLIKMVFDSKERNKHADVGTFFVGYNEKGNALSLRMAKEQYKDMLEQANNAD